MCFDIHCFFSYLYHQINEYPLTDYKRLHTGSTKLYGTMGKSTKSTLDKLKFDLADINVLDQDDLDKIRGGKNTPTTIINNNTKWNTGIGGIVPQ